MNKIPAEIDKNLSLWKQLLYSAIDDNGKGFPEVLKYVAKELNLTLKELATKSEIPISTFYKLTIVSSSIT